MKLSKFINHPVVAIRLAKTFDQTHWTPTLTASLKTEMFLAVLAMLAAAWSGYMLFQDVHILGLRDWEEPSGAIVAHLESIDRIVRHRPAQLPVWTPANKLQSLYSSDQIFTDADSGAKLLFIDNTVVELGQNTLIVVERNTNQETSLNLIHGSLFAQTSAKNPSTIVVRAGATQSRLASRDAAMQLRSNGAGTIAVEAISGKLNVQTLAKRPVIVESSQRWEVSQQNQSGTLAIIPVQLLGPKAKQVFIGDDFIDFNWTAPANVQVLALQIATASDFGHRLAEVPVAASSSYRWSVPAGLHGNFYWRIVYRQGDSNHAATSFTQVGEFHRLEDIPPELLQPMDATVFPEQNPEIIFEAVVEYATFFQLEVAKEPDFSTFVLQKNRVPMPFSWRGLEAGHYYWRVRASNAESAQGGTHRWSHTGTFDIGTPPPKPTPAELEAPDLDDSYHIDLPKSGALKIRQPWWASFIFINTANAATDAQGVIRWKDVKGAAAYATEIATDREFTHIVQSIQVTAPELDVHTLPPGEYFLRVSTIDAEGHRGKPSKPSALTIAKQQVPAVSPSPARPIAKKTPLPMPKATPAVAQQTKAFTPPRAAPPPPPPAAQPVAAASKTSSIVALAWLPMNWRYQAKGGADDATINAVILNSFAVHGRVLISPAWGLELRGERAATQLFANARTGANDSPQQPFKAMLNRIAGDAVYHFGELRSWQFRLGLARQSMLALQTADDSMLTSSLQLWRGLRLGGGYQSVWSELWSGGFSVVYFQALQSTPTRVRKPVSITLDAQVLYNLTARLQFGPEYEFDYVKANQSIDSNNVTLTQQCHRMGVNLTWQIF